MKFFYIAMCLSFIKLSEAGIGDIFNKTKNIAEVAKNTGEALVKKAPELIPSTDDLLDFSKQAFAGLPFQAGVSVINKICIINNLKKKVSF